MIEVDAQREKDREKQENIKDKQRWKELAKR